MVEYVKKTMKTKDGKTRYYYVKVTTQGSTRISRDVYEKMAGKRSGGSPSHMTVEEYKKFKPDTIPDIDAEIKKLKDFADAAKKRFNEATLDYNAALIRRKEHVWGDLGFISPRDLRELRTIKNALEVEANKTAEIAEAATNTRVIMPDFYKRYIKRSSH